MWKRDIPGEERAMTSIDIGKQPTRLPIQSGKRSIELACLIP
jgi:hypothetical protein